MVQFHRITAAKASVLDQSQGFDRRAFLRLAGLAAVGAGAASILANGVRAEASSKIFLDFSSGLALDGYDAVAYHTESSPTKGSAEFTHEWNGATWHFASAENRDAFAAEPAKYAPQYGGHCAWAAAQGKPAKGDPNHWKVVDGKLYLNYNGSIQRRWEKDIPGFITAADEKWPTVTN